jgi:hypothetical protein
MANVTTEATGIGEGGFLIQNLGPDPVYIGFSGVTTSDGIEVASGVSLVMGETGETVYAVSIGTSDVRTLDRGEGLFYPPASS